MAVVIYLDDGGIEVRIGPGVILRSGSEDKQLNIKISQIYLSVALDKIKLHVGLSSSFSRALELKFNYASL